MSMEDDDFVIDADAETVINLRLTGRDVYRAVKNFIKNELKFDPAKMEDKIYAEAQGCAIVRAITYFLKGSIWHPGSGGTAHVRGVIYTVAMDEAREALRKEFAWAVKTIVREKTKEIEAVIRDEFLAGMSPNLREIVRDALDKKKT